MRKRGFERHAAQMAFGLGLIALSRGMKSGSDWLEAEKERVREYNEALGPVVYAWDYNVPEAAIHNTFIFIDHLLKIVAANGDIRKQIDQAQPYLIREAESHWVVLNSRIVEQRSTGQLNGVFPEIGVKGFIVSLKELSELVLASDYPLDQRLVDGTKALVEHFQGMIDDAPPPPTYP